MHAIKIIVSTRCTIGNMCQLHACFKSMFALPQVYTDCSWHVTCSWTCCPGAICAYTQWNPLFRTVWNEDTSINRTHLSVSKTTLYNPWNQDTTNFCLKCILICTIILMATAPICLACGVRLRAHAICLHHLRSYIACILPINILYARHKFLLWRFSQSKLCQQSVQVPWLQNWNETWTAQERDGQT